MNIDKLFKIGLLALLVIFMIIYFQNSRNGRYVIIHPEVPTSALDTRECIVHFYNAEKSQVITLNLISGERTVKDLR